MKAAMLHGVKDLRVEDVQKPEIEAGTVLVKIKAATTCGTDLKIFQRGYVEKIIKLPTIFGHEWAGEVSKVSDDLDWPEEGMRVRAGNSAPCLKCPMCQKGMYNLCEDMIWLWGAYAEYIRVPARMVLVNMQKIPEHVSYAEAAVTEPLACVLHGDEQAGVKLDDTVAIIGAGPIGLLHLLIVKKLGAKKTIMIDLVDERLDMAKKIGADEIINSSRENAVERVQQLTSGRGASVAIEAIGLQSTWEQALKLVGKGGKVLEFGGCPAGTRVNINAEMLHYGQRTIIGVFHATPLHFSKALSMISSRTIDVRPLITKEMKLDNINEAFEMLTTSKSDIKIAIKP